MAYESTGTIRTKVKVPIGLKRMTTKNALMALPFVAAVFLGVLFWGALTGGSDPDRPSPLVGRMVPEFTLPPLGRAGRSLDADGLSGTDLADGQVKIVNFWASWCAPCRVEHPLLTALAESGVPVHGIVYKDRPASAKQFLTMSGDPFSRIGFDQSGRASIDWGVSAVPETFVVGGDGRILWHHAGALTPALIEKKIRPLLKVRGAADGS